MATNAEEFALKPDDIPFATDGLKVPTYWVEHIRGAMVSRGFIKLNLIENRLDAISGTLKAVHVVTVVTPLDQLRAWAKYVTDIADQNDLPPLPAPGSVLDTSGAVISPHDSDPALRG